MGSDLAGWAEAPVEAVMLAIIDYRGKTPPKTNAGIPLITAKIIKGGAILDPQEFVTRETYDVWMRRGLPEVGDVLVTTEAPLGEVAQLRSADVALAQRVILLRGKPDRLDNTFLRFALQSSVVQARLTARSSGTTVSGIKQSELRKVQLPLPPLHEQRRIAAVLGALDDKIELNRKMNKTLEEMAQAIFKSRFIDFEGNSDFVDSDLGRIPRGWEVVGLQALAEVTMGTSPKGDTYNDHGDGVPLINGPAQYGDFFPAVEKWTTAPTKLSRRGDLILCVRGSTTGRRVVADGTYCLGRGVCSIRSTAGHQEFARLSVHFALRRLLTKTTGSVFPNLSGPSIKGLSVVSPPDDVLASFTRVAEPLRHRQWQNVLEKASLSGLRDALLPKLISGEVRVPDAEQELEAVS